MDHIPGPIIATAAPRTATIIAVSECPLDAKNTHTPAMAMVIPASGVHKPRRRNTAATPAIRYRKLGANLAGASKCMTAQ